MKNKFYDESFPELAERYMRDGLTHAEIAAKLGIPLPMLYKRAEKFAEFAAALRLPCAGAALDDKVEQALLRRALGYRQDEVVCEDIIDRESGEVTREVKRRTVSRQVPPDVRAAMVWLQQRRPQRWGASAIPDEEIELDPDDDSLL